MNTDKKAVFARSEFIFLSRNCFVRCKRCFFWEHY